MKRALSVLVLSLAIASPALAAGPLPDFEWKGVGGIGHEVKSGWHKPVLFITETVLGPHYGPVYFGGAGMAQSADGVTSTTFPIVTYIAKGYLRGWFRGLAFQVGQRRQTGVSGSPGYYFMIGAAR